MQRTSVGCAEGVKALRIVDKGEGMLREGRGGDRRSGGWVMPIASREKMGKAEIQCLE
jgi:hypothetical protein